MKCPYYGVPCKCQDICKLDIRKREVISGRLKVPDNVRPPKKTGFRKSDNINASTIRTEQDKDGYTTYVIGGSLDGEKWKNDTLQEALSEHDTVCALVRVIAG